jgi:hypothetical protein
VIFNTDEQRVIDHAQVIFKATATARSRGLRGAKRGRAITRAIAAYNARVQRANEGLCR